MNKTIAVVLLFLLVVVISNNSQEGVMVELKSNPSSVSSNQDLVKLVGSISNIPSPSSDLKSVTQLGNTFSVRYGDGTYSIISNDTHAMKFDCSNANSMKPTFSCEDKIILKKSPSKKEIKIGDMILYESSNNKNKWVLHRVVSISGDKYYVRGDNWDGTVAYTNGDINLLSESTTFSKIKYKAVGVIYQ